MHNRLMSNVGPFFFVFFFRICLNFCMRASFSLFLENEEQTSEKKYRAMFVD